MSNSTRVILTTAFTVVLLCAATASAQWSHFGLEERTVKSLAYDFLNPYDPGELYACTDSGLYHIHVEQPPTSWAMLGLAGKRVSTMAVISPLQMIAGLDTGAQLIWRTANRGISWSATGSGFGGTEPFAVTMLDASPGIPDVYRYILGTSGGGVGRSTNVGTSFTGVWDFLGWFGFVKMDSLRPQIAFAGGMSGLWGPLLIKTVDTGKTWSLLMEGYGAPANSAYDIAIHPTTPDTVWLVLENCILKSNDSGSHWGNYYCPSPSFRFRTIEIDQRRPGYLYASGGIAGGPLTVHYSRDGGVSWNTVSDTVLLQNPVTDILLTAVDSVTNRLFFATERGVFSYTETVPYVSCCVGTTGNVNGLGIVDLTDLSWLVSWLIEPGGYVPRCMEEANVNGQGIVDLADLSALVSYLTGDGYLLPPCPE